MPVPPSAAVRRAGSGDEAPVARTRRARRIHRALLERYPYAHCELDFETPLQLLVATVLSAQSTDKMVNTVTPALFARYPTALDYAKADRAELEEMIHSTGFFRNKANSLIGLGAAVVEKHDGVLPHTLPELVALPAFALFFSGLDWATVAGVALADLGIVAVGTVLAAMAVATRARELMLPLLFLPLAIPVVVGGVGASVASDPGAYLGFLALYDAVFAIISWASFEYVVTE